MRRSLPLAIACTALLAITAVLLLPIAASAAFSSRVSNGRLFEYTFEEGQLDDAASAALDVTGLNPLGPINLNLSTCSFLQDRPGLLLPGATSQVGSSANTIAAVLDAVETARAFTMEAWIQPVMWDQTSMMFGFGLWTAPRKSFACASEQLTWEMHQDTAVVGAKQAQGPFPGKSCSTQQASFDLPYLMHAVITYAVNGTARFWLDNQLVWVQTVKSWYPYWIASHRLFISPDLDFSREDLTWRGSLHLISMYNRILSDAEIATNYAAGIPNAKPQPVPRSQRLGAFQDTPATHDLSLAITDFDTAAQDLTIWIMSAPASGTLQLSMVVGGLTTLTSAMLPFQISAADLSGAIYAPAAGVSGSGVANFTFAGHDGNAYGRLGVVLFDVTPLPVVRNTTLSAYLQVPQPITIESSNLLAAEFESWITGLPARGQLFQSIDGITATGTALTPADLPCKVTNAAQKVVYVSSSAGVSGSAGCFFSDSFSFVLRLPSTMLQSRMPGAVEVEVCNRLVVSSASANLTMLPFESKAFVLGGQSLLVGETVRFVLQSLPSVGKLLGEDGTTLDFNSRIAPGATVTYRRNLILSANADPTVSYALDSFSFRLTNNVSLASPGTLYSAVASMSLRTSPALFASRIADASLQALYLFGDGDSAEDPALATTITDSAPAHSGGELTIVPRTFALVRRLNNTRGLAFTGGEFPAPSNSTNAVGTVNSLTDALGLYNAIVPSAAFTIDLWIDIPLITLERGVIFGLGSRDPVTKEMSYDIAISQSGNEIRFAVGSVWRTTPVIDFTETATHKTINLLLACTSSLCQLAVDGATRTSFTPPAAGVLSWPTQQTTLVLAESSASQFTLGARDHWGGSILLAAVYSRALSIAERTANFNAGLAASRPQVLPRSQEATVLEYSRGDLPLAGLRFGGFAFNASTIGASAVIDPTVDGGPWLMNGAVDPVRCPNGVATALNGGSVFDLWISALPVFGSLLVMEPAAPPRALSSASLPFLLSPLCGTELAYAPPLSHFWGRHADAFEWMVSDGRSVSAAGIVSMSVTQVVVPPLSLNCTVDGYELTPLRVTLAGRDVDLNAPIDSPIAAFWLHSLPTAGRLFAGHTAGANQSINVDAPFLAAQIALPFRIAASVPLWYVSDVAATAPVSAADSIVGLDSFTFRSEVKSQPSNVTATVRITLRNHLVAGINAAGATTPISFQLRQPAFGSTRTAVEIALSGGVRQSTGPNSYLSQQETTQFIVLQLPLFGNLTASDGSRLCPPAAALPCALPSAASSLFYSRDLAALSPSDHQQSDSLVYAVSSTLTRGSASVTLRSAPVTLALSIAPPRTLPAFVRSLMRLPAQTVAPYTAAAYNFSLSLSDPNGDGLSSDPAMAAYRVTMSVSPATAGFNLPSAARIGTVERVQFISGSAESNSVAVFSVPDIPTLNAVFSEMTFQPLFEGEYNLTVSVASGSANVGSGEVLSVSAVIVWSVSVNQNLYADAAPSSSGGIFSFLSGSNLLYVWFALGGFVLLLVLAGAWRKWKAHKRAKEKRRRKEEKARREEEGTQGQKDMMQAVMQLTALTATSLSATTSGLHGGSAFDLASTHAMRNAAMLAAANGTAGTTTTTGTTDGITTGRSKRKEKIPKSTQQPASPSATTLQHSTGLNGATQAELTFSGPSSTGSDLNTTQGGSKKPVTIRAGRQVQSKPLSSHSQPAPQQQQLHHIQNSRQPGSGGPASPSKTVPSLQLDSRESSRIVPAPRPAPRIHAAPAAFAAVPRAFAPAAFASKAFRPSAPELDPIPPPPPPPHPDQDDEDATGADQEAAGATDDFDLHIEDDAYGIGGGGEDSGARDSEGAEYTPSTDRADEDQEQLRFEYEREAGQGFGSRPGEPSYSSRHIHHPPHHAAHSSASSAADWDEWVPPPPPPESEEGPDWVPPPPPPPAADHEFERSVSRSLNPASEGMVVLHGRSSSGSGGGGAKRRAR